MIPRCECIHPPKFALIMASREPSVKTKVVDMALRFSMPLIDRPDLS